MSDQTARLLQINRRLSFFVPKTPSDHFKNKTEKLQPDVLIGSELQETLKMSHIAPSTLMISATSMDSGPAPLVSSLTNYCWDLSCHRGVVCSCLPRLCSNSRSVLSLTHPVYICESGTMPLLIGVDLLKRFEAFIDLGEGELRAGVRKPLLFIPPSFPDSRCLAVGDPERGETACSLPSSKPSEIPSDVFSQIEQVVDQADALTNDVERDKLRQLLLKHKDFLSLDSLDCGLTTIHEVRIPTLPHAAPTFVHQYKTPLASHRPVQEIISSLLAKGIIRPCNSTYSAQLWSVKKPNGKWQLSIDYRQLNKQVPLSRWPMAHLDQELPKVKDAKYFSILDIASGFWTIPVHKSDQHKLAFSLWFTSIRCFKSDQKLLGVLFIRKLFTEQPQN